MVAGKRASEAGCPSDRREAVPFGGLAPVVLTAFACFLLFAVIWRAQGLQESPFAARITATSPDCRYGSQPYYFEDNAAAFNETPLEWRLHAFASACQPRQLFAAMINASVRGNDSSGSGRQLVIAMFGDRCVYT